LLFDLGDLGYPWTASDARVLRPISMSDREMKSSRGGGHEIAVPAFFRASLG